jgi:hypothetical protein
VPGDPRPRHRKVGECARRGLLGRPRFLPAAWAAGGLTGRGGHMRGPRPVGLLLHGAGPRPRKAPATPRLPSTATRAPALRPMIRDLVGRRSFRGGGRVLWDRHAGSADFSHSERASQLRRHRLPPATDVRHPRHAAGYRIQSAAKSLTCPPVWRCGEFEVSARSAETARSTVNRWAPRRELSKANSRAFAKRSAFVGWCQSLRRDWRTLDQPNGGAPDVRRGRRLDGQLILGEAAEEPRPPITCTRPAVPRCCQQ